MYAANGVNRVAKGSEASERERGSSGVTELKTKAAHRDQALPATNWATNWAADRQYASERKREAGAAESDSHTDGTQPREFKGRKAGLRVQERIGLNFRL